MRISAVNFVRQFGRRCDDALAEPVIITRNGCDRLVIMSIAMYRELCGVSNGDDQVAPQELTLRGKKCDRVR